ncbi:hypothetical protein BDV25DRAFT_14601 [Aspergillus avenaceus]|uniref:Uncharacterized protein n=1 Tax=Aspergillus avenaceus TaxID=36643 RepID=A0A5N6U5C0_ASPAV|nr:hypothetical protein BDV25DRAFT_14601 [Aspergillus avenaceus]
MTAQIVLTGKVFYQLLDEINNPKDSTVTKEVTTKISRSITRSTFQQTSSEVAKKEASSASTSVEVGAAYKVLSGSVKAGYETSTEVTTTLSQLYKIEEEEHVEYEETTTRTFNIGAGHRYFIYQEVFQAPGIYVRTGTIKAGDNLDVSEKTVEFVVEMEPIRFLQDIAVKYGDDAFSKPSDSIYTINNENGDVNSGFGGKYVWLVPKYTTKLAEACTSVDIIVTEDPHSGYSDLAAGAGGDYRYLKPNKNTNTPAKISEVAMHRTPKSQYFGLAEVQKLGYDGMSDDINSGRKKDWLRIIWKTLNVTTGVVQS